MQIDLPVDIDKAWSHASAAPPLHLSIYSPGQGTWEIAQEALQLSMNGAAGRASASMGLLAALRPAPQADPAPRRRTEEPQAQPACAGAACIMGVLSAVLLALFALP